MVSRPASVSRNSTVETQIDQVEFIDEDINYAHRVGIADVFVEAFGEQRALAAMFALDEALHQESFVYRAEGHQCVDSGSM
ncbi:hypothetical protein AO287_08120 [Pseudomonas savastanoi]|uniref:Uncharacterized protein n=1 Tax=Pseudomonas savastanoi TaxID=29438 RepID=A0AAW3M795_PSESS|nr:hypothetical protein AO287_08120 [Pseudomonas savastanoi]